MIRQKLSCGFVRGVNNITLSTILEWQHSDNINWKAFLWYIADYVTIVDFGNDWVKVNIVTDKQFDFFYHRVIEYNPDIHEHNYNVDIRNNLWLTHKKGTERNRDILQRLLT